jgi:hypothetical protein
MHVSVRGREGQGGGGPRGRVQDSLLEAHDFVIKTQVVTLLWYHCYFIEKFLKTYLLNPLCMHFYYKAF